MSHVPCGDRMTRRRRLPAASTWVLWSSPLLLIVLVLTLGSTSRAGTPATSGPDRVASTVTSTTTTPPSRPRRVARRRATPDPTSTTTSTTPTSTSPTATPAPTSPDPVTSTAASSNSIASSASASPVASATNGPVSGQLGRGLSSAVVPLAGPRTWALASSAPLSATLACGAQTTTVAASFVVGSTACQLDLVDPTDQTVTWQLTPEG